MKFLDWLKALPSRAIETYYRGAFAYQGVGSLIVCCVVALLAMKEYYLAHYFNGIMFGSVSAVCALYTFYILERAANE